METTGPDPKPTGPDSSPTTPEAPTIIPDQFAAGFGWVIKNNTVMFQQPNNVCALVYPTARSFNKSDVTSLVYRITRIKEVPQTERQFKNRNLQADHKVARQCPLARGVSVSHPSTVAVQTPLANGRCLATEMDLPGDHKNQAVTENNNVLSVLQADELTSTESERAYILNQQHLKKSRPLHLNGDMRKDEGEKLVRPFKETLNHAAVTENNNILSALQADVLTSAESESASILNQQHLKKTDPCLQCVTQMQHDPNLMRHLTTQEKTSSQTLESTDAETDSGEENTSAKIQLQAKSAENGEGNYFLAISNDKQTTDVEGKICGVDLDVQKEQESKEPQGKHTVQPQKFSCVMCNFATHTKTSLQFHMKSHEGYVEPFVATTASDVRGHVRPAAENFRCDRCNFATHTKTSLQFHMKSHEEPEPFVAMTTDDVTAHSRQNVKPAAAFFKCDRCDFKARSARRLDAHLRRQHAEGSVRCTLCPFTALNQRGLNMHVRRTHSNKSQEDPDDLEREKNDDISEHLEKHGKTGLLQCPQCDYLTKWRKNMRQHVRDAHTTSHNLHKTSHNLGYKCPDCGQTFRTVSLLRLHVRRKHTGERPFQCPHCSYAALVSSHLERHILRHTGVRPYMCEDCGYMASTKDVLSNHRRTHSGEKPYRCEVCGYAARRRHHLQGHMAKHAPNKPDRKFKCEFCDYAAVRKFHLVRHMSRHYGEKRFKCYMCEYSTVDNSRLQAHIRAHTGEKPFRCEMCEFATARKDHLKQHVIRCWRKQTNKQTNR